MKEHSTSNNTAPITSDEYATLLVELKATREKLHFMEALVDNIPLPLFSKDKDGVLLLVNKAYEDFFNTTKDTVLNKSIKKLDYFSKEEQESYHTDALWAIENLSSTHCERVYTVAKTNKPSLFWSQAFATPQTEERGLIGVIVDITKQKVLEYDLEQKVKELHTAQEDIQLSKERMRLMLDNMPLAAQIWSEDGELLETSLEAARLFEFENTEDYIKNFHSIHPEYQPNGKKSLDYIQELIATALREGKLDAEWTHISNSGEKIPVQITCIRSLLQGETVLLAFLKDMREYYAQMEKIREADEYTKLMLDLSPLGTLVWDSNFTLMHCNKALAISFGLQEAQDFITHFFELIPEYQPDGQVSLQVMQDALQNALETSSSQLSWMGKSITGEEVPCHVYAVRSKFRGTPVVVAYVKDLRESIEQEKKLQLAEQRTAAILNGIPMGINLLTPNFEILDCNDVAVGFSGYSSREEYIANFATVLPPKQPDGRDGATLICDILTEARQKGTSRHEIMAMNVHQTEFPLEITAVNAHLEQEDLYIVYTRDLRETKRMLEEIELSREAAEQSAQAKSDFLANMSHEIRTPMNGILGLLHLLSKTPLNDHQQDYLQKALFSTNELLRIINDILDFSKIEAGKLEMETITFTLHGICSELQSLLGHSIHSKNLVFELNEGLFPGTALVGDPLRLKQVLLNLLGNAIKFTSKGKVSLIIESAIIRQKVDTERASSHALHCKFIIKDTGIGLSSEQVKGLFSAFSQADSSVTRKYGGTGLGLAISKRIVEMMRGNIWVESALGQGSSFFFTAIFPVAAMQENDTPLLTIPISTEQRVHSEHLLLVEDNQINQIIAEELLKSVGYTLDIANNGQEALEMLAENKYAAVLMDIQMPILDGLSATKAIRAQPQFAELPIIAMSAHAMSGDKEKSLLHGMNDHITKPISPEILYSTLDFWLSKQKI